VKLMNEKLEEEYYAKYSGRRNFKWIDNVKRKLSGNGNREVRLIEIFKKQGFHSNQPIKD